MKKNNNFNKQIIFLILLMLLVNCQRMVDYPSYKFYNEVPVFSQEEITRINIVMPKLVSSVDNYFHYYIERVKIKKDSTFIITLSTLHKLQAGEDKHQAGFLIKDGEIVVIFDRNKNILKISGD